MLGLSEEVSGVTLVALGNGAPDIFAGMVFRTINQLLQPVAGRIKYLF